MDNQAVEVKIDRTQVGYIRARHRENMKGMGRAGKLDSSGVSGHADDGHGELNMQRGWEGVLVYVSILNMVPE